MKFAFVTITMFHRTFRSSEAHIHTVYFMAVQINRKKSEENTFMRNITLAKKVDKLKVVVDSQNNIHCVTVRTANFALSRLPMHIHNEKVT